MQTIHTIFFVNLRELQQLRKATVIGWLALCLFCNKFYQAVIECPCEYFVFGSQVFFFFVFFFYCKLVLFLLVEHNFTAQVSAIHKPHATCFSNYSCIHQLITLFSWSSTLQQKYQLFVENLLLCVCLFRYMKASQNFSGC